MTACKRDKKKKLSGKGQKKLKLPCVTLYGSQAQSVTLEVV
jgi:hypothetical protein